MSKHLSRIFLSRRHHNLLHLNRFLLNCFKNLGISWLTSFSSFLTPLSSAFTGQLWYGITCLERISHPFMISFRTHKGTCISTTQLLHLILNSCHILCLCHHRLRQMMRMMQLSSDPFWFFMTKGRRSISDPKTAWSLVVAT
jgi:hypothetical protein